jgi:hypothetical protein
VAVATIDAVGLDVGVPAGAERVVVAAPQAATAPDTQRVPSMTANLRITASLVAYAGGRPTVYAPLRARVPGSAKVSG